MANIGQPERVWEVVPDEEPCSVPQELPEEEPLEVPEEDPEYAYVRR